MSTLVTPAGYRPLLDNRQTEHGIKLVKDFFQQDLAAELKLRRITAPLFVLRGQGINDDLNGVERPVTFPVPALGGAEAEIVHSLAKWKRLALAEQHIAPGYGIYTDMNAIRADEEPDNLHSLYVDQWDWEAVITAAQRTAAFLERTVRGIYNVMRRTEYIVGEHFPQLTPFLPAEITLIHSEDLRRRYPGSSPREREDLICRQCGAVFIRGIGGTLGDGRQHDGRAPDYDDWSTCGEDGLVGLNGDILIWYPPLQRACELSSMGIRVDPSALDRQLQLTRQEDRRSLYFHQKLLRGELPLSIGGGIGQSRLCMVLLQKAHVGEIQAGLWPEAMRERCRLAGIPLI